MYATLRRAVTARRGSVISASSLTGPPLPLGRSSYLDQDKPRGPPPPAARPPPSGRGRPGLGRGLARRADRLGASRRAIVQSVATLRLTSGPRSSGGDRREPVRRLHCPGRPRPTVRPRARAQSRRAGAPVRGGRRRPHRDDAAGRRRGRPPRRPDRRAPLGDVEPRRPSPDRRAPGRAGALLGKPKARPRQARDRRRAGRARAVAITPRWPSGWRTGTPRASSRRARRRRLRRQGDDDGPMHDRSLARALERACRRAGLPPSPHQPPLLGRVGRARPRSPDCRRRPARARLAEHHRDHLRPPRSTT